MFGFSQNRTADHRFRSVSTKNLEVVSAKLGEAQTERVAAEDAVRDAALAAVLSDDAEATMAPVRERLRRARDQVELCEAALDTARRAEKVRLAGVADQAEKSRIAAIKQHAGAATKHAAAMRDAIADMVEKFSAMSGAIGKAERLLKAEEIQHCFGNTPIELFLRDSVAGEFARIAARNPNLRLPIEVRFSPRAVAIHGRWDGDRPAIDDVIRAKLDIGVALRPAPPVPEPVDEMAAVAAAPAAVGEDRSEESSAEAIARYNAAVAAEQPGEQAARAEPEAEPQPEPEPELSVEDRAALTELLAQPIPAAPVSAGAGARGLRTLSKRTT